MAKAKAFGEKLKELREKKGLSQAALAEASGISQKAISFYERGEREPGWAAVQALAKALGVTCRTFEG